jgi:DNA-binding PadR family transcriptional regulator
VVDVDNPLATVGDELAVDATSIRKPIYCLPNTKPDAQQHLPLSPATLHVLLALTGGDLHGYGIMLEVARQSGGQYKMGPGTLYDNIKKLLKLGLVEEAPADDSEDEPRREYRLTQLGGSVLAAETERLAGVLREARRGLRLHEGRQS